MAAPIAAAIPARASAAWSSAVGEDRGGLSGGLIGRIVRGYAAVAPTALHGHGRSTRGRPYTRGGRPCAVAAGLRDRPAAMVS